MKTQNCTVPYPECVSQECVCLCAQWVSVSPNASQGDLAFLLQGFPFNSFWDWNYDEVIFLQKLPMSLVVSLGKFLKCIFNLYLSLCPLLPSLISPFFFGFPSLFSELSLDMSMCQCHITLRKYVWNNFVHGLMEKKQTSSLFCTSKTASHDSIHLWSHSADVCICVSPCREGCVIIKQDT